MDSRAIHEQYTSSEGNNNDTASYLVSRTHATNLQRAEAKIP